MVAIYLVDSSIRQKSLSRDAIAAQLRLLFRNVSDRLRVAVSVWRNLSFVTVRGCRRADPGASGLASPDRTRCPPDRAS